MKIAVVGSGLAGLVAADSLKNDHEVWLFEKENRAGMHAHSIDLDTEPPLRVDVPLRVFYEGYYPTLSRLYNRIGAEFHQVNYSASFWLEDGPVYFRYTNWQFGRLSLPFLGGWLSLKRTSRRILADLGRFYRLTARLEKEGRLAETDSVSLDAFFSRSSFSEEFRELFLLPVFAAICTCSIDAVRHYPAGVIIDYLRRGIYFSGVSRVKKGASTVVELLQSGVARHETGYAVEHVKPDGQGVSLRVGSENIHFDRVILATPAHRSLAMLDEYYHNERGLLKCIPYEASEVVMHSDESFMPRQRRFYSPVNFMVQPGKAAMATIYMNRVQPGMQKQKKVFQTWNPLKPVSERHLLAKSRFERPLVTLDSNTAAASLRDLQEDGEKRSLFFCGSYMWPGIPLLEQAAASGLVAGQLAGQADTQQEQKEQGRVS